MNTARRSLHLLVLTTTLLGAAACTAPEEDKLGYVGEYCKTDTDCLGADVIDEDLICQANRCVSTAVTPERETCQKICDRLVGECSRNEANCVSSCAQTTDGWSVGALDLFATCAIEQLTCEEARTANAPQICYQRIPLPSVRKQRCDLFIRKAQEYDGASDTAAFEALRDSCYRLGRTGTDADWDATTQVCEDELGQSSVAEFISCLNTAFTLSLTATVSNNTSPN